MPGVIKLQPTFLDRALPFPDNRTAKPCKYGHTAGRFRNGRCKECAWLRHPADSLMRSAVWRAANPDKVKRNSHAYRMNNPAQALLEKARERARKRGQPCTLKVTDIIIPEFCPLLGIKLERGKGVGGVKASSPSLDKIRPELGYVPSNVWVISYRANMIKNDATLQELQTLTERLARALS